MNGKWALAALAVLGLSGCDWFEDENKKVAPPAPPPPPATFTVGGTANGLNGTVVLRNNGGDDLNVTANGAFTFATRVTAGGAFAVTVATQPANQTCAVTGGTGAVAANVTSVAVTCANNVVAPVTFSVGGTVSGLSGTLVLQNNGGDNLTTDANGAFTFATEIASGTNYNVTVLSKPALQDCAVANGAGAAAADVANITVTCTDIVVTPAMVSIGGSVTGLAGTVALEINGGEDIFIDQDGNFTFPTLLAAGSNYTVAVESQPIGQTCTLANASGVATNNVTNIALSCVGAAFPTASFLSVGTAPNKRLVMNWEEADGVTHYRLYEDPTGDSGFAQLGNDFAPSSRVFETELAAHLRSGARYMVEACNSVGCTPSNTVTLTPDDLLNSISYLKSMNTDANDNFGGPIASSADGMTFAVAARNEDGTGTGVNADLEDNAGNNAGAVYVFIRQPGTIVAQAYLKASNTEQGTDLGDSFGHDIAISADGNTLAVSAIVEDSGATGVNGNQADNSTNAAGAVYVFVRSGSTWTQQAYLKASNTDSEDRFGSSVAISGDGNTLVVGARDEASNATGVDGDQSNDSAGSAGAAYVFTRTGTSWAQTSYLKASNTESPDSFGTNTAISSDGNTIAVGAPSEFSAADGIDGNQADNTAPAAGAVYVFVRSGASWVQQAYVKASNSDGSDTFGNALTLSGDGNTLAVGAPNEASIATGINGSQGNSASVGAGAVYVFTRIAGVWEQQAYVKASNTAGNDFFGATVDLSDDGNILAVGAGGEDSNALGVDRDQTNNSASDAGAAYVFTRTSDTWSQRSYIKAFNTRAGDSFGAVALSGDGQTLLVGAPGEDSAGRLLDGLFANRAASSSGAVYLY